MSRSYKKHPIAGISTAASEKKDKQRYNRRFRRATRDILSTNPATETLPHLYDYSNPWCMDKDGKRWFNRLRFPQRMRK
jgi:hypothetical protein